MPRRAVVGFEVSEDQRLDTEPGQPEHHPGAYAIDFPGIGPGEDGGRGVEDQLDVHQPADPVAANRRVRDNAAAQRYADHRRAPLPTGNGHSPPTSIEVPRHLGGGCRQVAALHRGAPRRDRPWVEWPAGRLRDQVQAAVRTPPLPRPAGRRVLHGWCRLSGVTRHVPSRSRVANGESVGGRGLVALHLQISDGGGHQRPLVHQAGSRRPLSRTDELLRPPQSTRRGIRVAREGLPTEARWSLHPGSLLRVLWQIEVGVFEGALEGFGGGWVGGLAA
jgi:hypothetical protein